MRLLTATIVAGLVLCGHAMPIIKIDTPDFTAAPEPSAQAPPVIQVYRQAASTSNNAPGVGAPPVARPVALPVHKSNEDDDTNSTTAQAVPVIPTIGTPQQPATVPAASPVTDPTMSGLANGANVATGTPTMSGFGTGSGLPGTTGTDMSNSMGLGSTAGTLGGTGMGTTGAPTTGSATAPPLSAWDQAESDYQKDAGTGTGAAAAQSAGMMAGSSGLSPTGSGLVGGSIGAPTVTVTGTSPGGMGGSGLMGSAPGVASGIPGATTQGGTQMSVIQANAVTDITGMRENAVDAAAGMNQQQVGVNAASGVPSAGAGAGALNNGMSTMSGVPGSTGGLMNTGGTVGVSPMAPTISVGGVTNTGLPGTSGMGTTGMPGTATGGTPGMPGQTTGSLGVSR